VEKRRASLARRLGEPVLALGYVRVRDGNDILRLPTAAVFVVTEAKLRVFSVSRGLARRAGVELGVWDRRSVRILFDRRSTMTRLTVSLPGECHHLIVDVPRQADPALLHALAGGSVIAA
jgi:hypothetical protein